MPWTFWKKERKGAVCSQLAEQFPPVAGHADCGARPPLPQPIAQSPGCIEVTLVRGICERCGACCAFFPVSFPEDEAEEGTGNNLLSTMSLPAGHLRRVMKGTEIRPHRCIALQGEIGLKVSCFIYNNRPSTCRMFRRSWEENIGNLLCDKARAVLGLQPFSQY